MKKQNQLPLPFYRSDDVTQSDSERAINQVFTHHTKVVIFDTHNPKALDRSGKLGASVRDLLKAIDVFRGVQQGAKFEKIK
jgi:hypothetical protein